MFTPTCKKSPRKSTRSASRTLALLVVFMVGSIATGTGCNTPTQPRCEAFADHMIDLLAHTEIHPEAVRKRAHGLRDSMISACLREASEENIECVLRQGDLGLLQKHCN